MPQLSDRRCPRSSCPDYRKRLNMDAGQDESRGDLAVRHWCPSCPYVESGPSTPEAARRTSTTVRKIAADRLLAQRLSGFSRDTGVEIPMRKDVPEVADV